MVGVAVRACGALDGEVERLKLPGLQIEWTSERYAEGEDSGWRITSNLSIGNYRRSLDHQQTCRLIHALGGPSRAREDARSHVKALIRGEDV